MKITKMEGIKEVFKSNMFGFLILRNKLKTLPCIKWLQFYLLYYIFRYVKGIQYLIKTGRVRKNKNVCLFILN